MPSVNRPAVAARVRRLSVILGLAALLLASLPASAQLTGTRTVPGDYPTLEAAITDLNTQGVGAGGVVIDLQAGNPQTAPAGGYRIATSTASIANPVRVQGNGNTITASAAHTVGALNDALFKIVGTDAVTLTGFTLLENPANTVVAAATNTMTEWGIAVLYATVTDGARDVTLQGNTIDLNRTYPNTFGIYANATHSEAAPTTGATATGPTGGHSGLRVLGNTITDVNIGIVSVGPTAATDHDATVAIGGATAADGNTITNYGTTNAFSSYFSVSGTVNGILVRNVRAATIANNTVESSNGGTTAGTLRGIVVIAATTAPTGTTAHTITDNRISVRSGAATGAITALQVESGALNATGSLSILRNDFHTSGHTVAASGTVTFVNVGGSATVGPLATTISSNTFTNLSLNTSGSAVLIFNSFTRPAGGTVTVNNNAIVTGFSKTTAGGTVRGYDNFGSSPATVSETNSGNTFSNITLAATGTTALEVWRSADGAAPGSRKTITNNAFSNISNPGTGATTVLIASFSDSNFAGNTVSGNTISGVTAGGTVIGISSTSQNQNISGNTVHTLTGSGTGTVTGISISGGNSQVVAGNKIYNLENSNAGGGVFGITVSAGTTTEVNNNLVGDLRGPNLNAGNGLVGINITGGTTVNASYNTVRLAATSAGALFGSSALSASTTPTVTLRNNLLVNLSTANGTGLTAAYRRSSTTLTSYGAASNNNALFAGTPGPANVLFTDGTNTDTTLAAYRARMAPRDAAAVSENAPFLSTVGASADFLHIDPAVATQIESGGVPVAGIGTDFDGQARNATNPDIGADEFNGTLLDLVAPSITYAALANTTLTTNRALPATIADVSGVATGANGPRVYFRKGAGSFVSTACTDAAPAYTCTIDAAALGSVAVGDVVQYFVVAQDTAGTVGANPAAGFAATDVNNVTSPPTTPASYTVVAPFPATVNVGSAETITSLTNAGGLFEALNNGVLTGNVTATITTDLAGETGAVALNPLVQEGGTFGVTIVPSGARTVVGASATGNGLVNVNGADRITIDGLAAGGNSLLLRDTGAGGAIRWFNDASSNRLRNTTVESSSGATMIQVGAVAVTGNDDIEITGNTLRDRTDVAGEPPFNLVGPIAAAGPVTNSNLRIENNTLINFRQAGVFIGAGTDNVRVAGNTISQTAPRTTGLFGIVVNGMSGNNEFSGNTISGLTSSAAVSGISVASGVGTNVFRGNRVSGLLSTGATTATAGAVLGDLRNGTFTGNRIELRQANAASTGAIIGIQFAGNAANPANVVISNNFVVVAPEPASAQAVRGIFDFAFAGNTVAIDHNSVLVGGTASGAANSHAILRGSGTPTNASVRNNIAFNARTGGTGSHFAIGDQSLSTGTWTSDGNLFAGSGTGAAAASYFDLGTAATGTPVDFTTWRAGPPARDAGSTAGLASSFVIGDLFVDAATADLHLRATATAALDGGIALPSVTTDIDGDARSATTPDRGADEFVPPNTAPTLTPVAASRREGDAASASTIANVADAETPAGSIAVTVNGGASATANGVTVSGISVSAAGVVSANVVAACSATNASFTLRATDAGGLFDEEPLAVTVLPNIAPTLTYTGVSLVVGTGGTVNPATGPTDSGTVQSIAVQSTGTYTGTASVAATGVVTLANAGPLGTHTIVIRATDNCGATTDANLPVSVGAVVTDADLSIVKTSSLALGGNGVIQYTLQVGNAGPLGVTGAVVVDNFPASLSGATWTCTATGAGAACPASGSGNINALVDLPNGTSLVFAITAQLPASPPGPIVNTATVAVPAGRTDPNTGNNSSTVTDNLALFANGFEPITLASVAVVDLATGTPGVAQRAALPIADILRAARGEVAVEALALRVGGALAVVQARRVDGRAEVRLLTFQADRSWQVGPWVGAEPLPSFEWTWLGTPGAQGTLAARLVPGS